MAGGRIEVEVSYCEVWKLGAIYAHVYGSGRGQVAGVVGGAGGFYMLRCLVTNSIVIVIIEIILTHNPSFVNARRYNEQVFDLLRPSKTILKVRNHKSIGPYVEGLAQLAVNSYSTINELMEQGN